MKIYRSIYLPVLALLMSGFLSSCKENPDQASISEDPGLKTEQIADCQMKRLF